MNENASAWYGSVSAGANQIFDEHPMIKLLTVSCHSEPPCATKKG